jgi:hypothetical protein
MSLKELEDSWNMRRRGRRRERLVLFGLVLALALLGYLVVRWLR